MPENHLGIPVLALGAGREPCACAIGTEDLVRALAEAGWPPPDRFGEPVPTVWCEAHRPQ